LEAGTSAAHAADSKPAAGILPCETQPRSAGKRRRAGKSKGDDDDDEEEEDRLGKQAAMLNRLRLLRPIED